LDVADRKSDRAPVNEMKPALFFAASNDRVAVNVDTEIFAIMTAPLDRSHARQQAKSNQSTDETA
jgi:hypothetical protein